MTLPQGFSCVAPGVFGSAAPGSHPNTLVGDAKGLSGREDTPVLSVLSLCEADVDSDVLVANGVPRHLQLRMADYRGLPPEEMLAAIRFLVEGLVIAEREEAATDGTLREDDEALEGVLVHCNAGMGRTGTVLAAFRLALGLDEDAEAAIKFMRGSRRGSIQTFKQEDSLRDFEEFLRREQVRLVPTFRRKPEGKV